jgi:hypothetical protein
MKLKAIAVTLVLFVAGGASSFALAKGKPPKPGSSTTTGSTSTGTTTTNGKKQPKLAVCHKAGKSGRWVKITVANKAAQKAHLKRGDVLPDASGKCPANTPKTTTETTTTTD